MFISGSQFPGLNSKISTMSADERKLVVIADNMLSIRHLIEGAIGSPDFLKTLVRNESNGLIHQKSLRNK